LTTVQSRISAELSDQLRQGVDRDRRRLASHRYTSDPKAYDLYLWGLYSWNKRGKNDLLSAEQYFKGAIDRDPNFAAAYAGLAETYGVMVGYGAMPVADGVPKILDAAEKALQLDPNNAEALVSLATTKFRSMWDFAGADRDYRRAFALNPNYATGHEWYADLLRCMGRWNESRREIELAYKLDPLSPAINAMMCYSLYYERRYKEAIAFSRRASKLDPSLAAPSCVAYSYFSLGNIAGTIELMKQTKGPLGECDEMMADAYRRSGPRDFYRTGAEVLIQKQSASIETPVSIAAMYARNGDKDQAFAWLDKAFDRRVSHLMEVNVDPAFDSLRTDARYAALLQRIGLPRVTPPQAPVTN
jgi:tetratricopeptide (TPR) repeat protein